MVKDLIVTREIALNATPERVWEALTHPAITKQYMFNCEVKSDWKQGAPIIWSGRYQGRDVLQRGEILEIIPNRLLRFTAFDLHADDESAENYIYVTYELRPMDNVTLLAATLENFGGDEVRAENAALLWDTEILPKLKAFIETTL